MAKARAAVTVAIVFVMVACSAGYDSARPETCVRKGTWWMTDAKYPCTRAEFEAQQANDHQHP